MIVRLNDAWDLMIRTAWFFIWLSPILGCAYEFDEIQKTEIDINNHGEITQIELEFEEGDTVKIYEYTNLHYDLTGYGFSNVNVAVTIDDREVHSRYGLDGSFTVRTQPAVNTVHRMVLTATIDSGTGSLLDKLGGEKIVYTKEWVLHKKGKHPGPLNLRVLNNADGILELTWDKYLERNFIEYRISVTPYETSFGSVQYQITDPHTNRLKIPHYIGGGAQFWFNVLTDGAGPQHSVLEFEDEAVTFNKFEYIDGDLKVSWSKSKYHQTFDSYRIYDDHHAENLRYSTTDINDTTYVFEDYAFGGKTIVYLTTYPKDLPERNQNSYRVGYKHVFAGDTSMIRHHTYLYPSESMSNFYYGYSSYNYDIYNIQSSEKVNYTFNRDYRSDAEFQEMVSFDATPDGKRIVLSSGFSIYVLNQNREVVKSIHTYDIAGDYRNRARHTTVDNNDMMVMKLSRANQLFSFDLDKEIIIDTLTAAVTSIYAPEINNPGTYVKWYYRGQTYGTSITNGVFGTTVELEGRYPLFSPDGNVLYTFSGETIYVYSTTGGGLLRTETQPSAKKWRYVDHNSGYISWMSSDRVFYVFDPATSKLLHQSKVLAHQMRYFNGYAISSNGYARPLDL